MMNQRVCRDRYPAPVFRERGTMTDGRAEARSALRVLTLALVQRVDDPNADLWTLGRQCELVGQLVQEEVAK